MYSLYGICYVQSGFVKVHHSYSFVRKREMGLHIMFYYVCCVLECDSYVRFFIGPCQRVFVIFFLLLFCVEILYCFPFVHEACKQHKLIFISLCFFLFS
ncbi:hypothetical protein BJ742DRAFT_792164 [Cladochytrium replicatum]|nr:hypothetical protein BJ742DRAFT_792164 [Cladochytrium replicatum]